jgi:acyl-CoA thioester hydrolase
MPEPFRTIRRVEFHDTDMAGIVHFTAFFRYMEVAEHDLLRSLELSVVARDPHGAGPDEHISWPRVSAHCDFRAPARVDDLLQTEVAIEQLGNKSVTYRFTMTRDAVLVAEGRMTAVCCRIRPHLPPEPIMIPDAIRQKLAPFCV